MQITTRIHACDILLISVCLLLLNGCAGALNNKKVGHVSTVAIDQNVIIGNAATNQTPGKTMAGMFGGVIGALIASAVTAESDQLITDKFKTETHLDVVTTHCLKTTLENSPYWSERLIDGTQYADAVFNIHVFQYGFGSVDSKIVLPILGLTISLTERNGKQLWKSSRSIAKHPENLPRYKREEYLEDMTRYDTAAAALCRDLMQQFIEDEN